MELARELNRICQVRQTYGCIVPVPGFSPALSSDIEYISTHIFKLCVSLLEALMLMSFRGQIFWLTSGPERTFGLHTPVESSLWRPPTSWRWRLEPKLKWIYSIEQQIYEQEKIHEIMRKLLYNWNVMCMYNNLCNSHWKLKLIFLCKHYKSSEINLNSTSVNTLVQGTILTIKIY